jgi:hypothetical protein
MSTRDRRSQRIRDQLRAHPNPRSGQHLLAPRSFQDQLKRVYGGEDEAQLQVAPVGVSSELTRLARRRR